MQAFPQHNWHPWRFRISPIGWWEKIAVKYHNNDPLALQLITTYIQELGEKFKIKNLSDWYRVGESRLGWKRKHLEPLGGLARVLEKVYPDHPWQAHLFKLQAKRSTQYLIFSMLVDKLPGLGMSRHAHATCND